MHRGLSKSGTLWERRYRAAPIDGGTYFPSCCRYIELNLLRARIVRHPREHSWSSYRAHALGTTIGPLLSSHELLDRIGRNPDQRHKEYRALFRTALDDGFVDGLRAATNGGWVLEDERFEQQIAKALGRRVAPLARGRQPKADRRQLNLL